MVAGEPINLALAATADNDAAVVTMTIADLSSDWTVKDGALLADGNWTVQTSDVGYSFDAARDQVELIDYARFTSSDEVQTHSTECTNDDAVITLASGQSIELQRVITALNAADDRAELRLIEHGLTPEGGGWIGPSHSDWKINSGTSSIATLNNEDHRALILKNAGSINAADTHGHTIDTGSNVVLNSGLLKASESGGGGNHSISGEVSEHGTAPMHGAGALDFGPSSTSHVVFGSGAAGTLGLGDSFHFKNEISGFEGSGAIGLADVDHTPASISHSENNARTSGPEGAQTIELSLPGQHSADHFNIVSDHAGGAVVTHVPHDLMV